jgi:hypothetical protein
MWGFGFWQGNGLAKEWAEFRELRVDVVCLFFAPCPQVCDAHAGFATALWLRGMVSFQSLCLTEKLLRRNLVVKHGVVEVAK